MLKKIASLFLVLLLCLSIPALADEGITVTGTASVQLVPDIVVINLGVEANAGDVLTAQRTANTAASAVINALIEDLQLDPADIGTSRYDIMEKYNYDSMRGESVRDGYVATCMLSIVVRDVDQAGAVIDAAMQAGANRLDSVEFSSSDQRTARDEALTLAVQDGIRKAQTIAAAAGITLKKLPDSITERSVSNYSPTSNYWAYDTEVATAKGAGATQLQSGMLTVTANVDIVYDID